MKFLSVVSVAFAAIIPSLPEDSCLLSETKVTNLNSTALQGTWYLYQHQPDLVEGIITSGCKCTRSELTKNDQFFDITNKCNYFTQSGPLIPTTGQLEEISTKFTSGGKFYYKLNGQTQRYQILDITEDGKHMLATVCLNSLGIKLRSFCVYYFGREKPTGSNLPVSVLSRFDTVSKTNGLYKPQKMRLDYKDSTNCSW